MENVMVILYDMYMLCYLVILDVIIEICFIFKSNEKCYVNLIYEMYMLCYVI